MKKTSPLSRLYMRNFIFGFEDGVVSTVGLLSGVVVGGIAQSSLLLTGIILIAVEAFSMGVGSFLSEDTVEEAQQDKQAFRSSLIGGLVMFFSYMVAGIIPLAPYFFSYTANTVAISIVLSFIALLALGVISSRYFGMSVLKYGLRMLVVGGAAIAVGVVIGRLAHL